MAVCTRIRFASGRRERRESHSTYRDGFRAFSSRMNGGVLMLHKTGYWLGFIILMATWILLSAEGDEDGRNGV